MLTEYAMSARDHTVKVRLAFDALIFMMALTGDAAASREAASSIRSAMATITVRRDKAFKTATIAAEHLSWTPHDISSMAMPGQAAEKLGLNHNDLSCSGTRYLSALCLKGRFGRAQYAAANAAIAALESAASTSEDRHAFGDGLLDRILQWTVRPIFPFSTIIRETDTRTHRCLRPRRPDRASSSAAPAAEDAKRTSPTPRRRWCSPATVTSAPTRR